MIDLKHPALFKADPGNPRSLDPERFELVKLSLRKFGFLLPLYARHDGLLLSGHRRSEAAAALGWRIPIVTLDREIRDTSGLNLTFNRATNDFTLTDIEHARLDAASLRVALEELPDAVAPFPCLLAAPVDVQAVIAANRGRFNRYAANAARGLAAYGIDMPIVIGPDGRVLNGIGRLQYASERSRPTIDAVTISSSETVELIAATMNGLSMDFRFTDAFRDTLRTNAFRRARQRRKTLGGGYLFPLGVDRCKDFSVTKNSEQLRQLYGARVLDFGAGHGDEARMLRRIGISVTTFEPYRVSKGRPRRSIGRYSASGLLRAVQAGFEWPSILLSSVLNSVPFEADRRHIVAIVAALAGQNTTLYAAARSRHDPNWMESKAGIGLGQTAARSARFVLADEPGMTLSELNDAPKVQRYFQPSEFYSLFADHFEEVTIGVHINNVTATCRHPRPIDLTRLRAAIEFEFDLPYSEGRMGFVDKALNAFSKRLGVSL